MAARKPLVLNGGNIEQLQSGDTLVAPTTSPLGVTLTNASGVTLDPGMVVYPSGADQVSKARANASGTAFPIGMAEASIANSSSGNIVIEGLVTLTTGEWDAVAGTSGGLTAGTTYYLDPSTAGLITSTAPTTVGQFVVEVGRALSTTELILDIQQTIKL